MENVAQCIICGNPGVLIYQEMRDSRFDTEGLFSIKKCKSCDLLWLDPRPTPPEIKKYYRDFCAVFSAKYSMGYERRFLGFSRQALREAIICGYYGYRHVHNNHVLCRLGNLLGKIPLLRSRAAYSLGEAFPIYSHDASGLILDVGCGDGNYLEMLQKLGLKVMGIENENTAVSISRKKGIPVFEGTLKEAKLADCSVDQVTMLHVIEHLFDPFEEINECFRILRTKGRLIIHTPNAGSLGRSLFQKNWYHLDPPRHLFVFSPKSIRLILKKSNFRKFQLKTLTNRSTTTFDNSAIIAKKGRLEKKGINPQRGRYLFALKESALVHLGRECGEEIELVAVK